MWVFATSVTIIPQPVDTHNNEHILRVQKYKEQRLEIGPQPTTVLCNETVYPDVCQGICCGIKMISWKITVF